MEKKKTLPFCLFILSEITFIVCSFINPTFGSSKDYYMYLYDRNFYSSYRKTPRLLSIGETYYIKTNGYSGNFWITYNPTGNEPQ